MNEVRCSNCKAFYQKQAPGYYSSSRQITINQCRMNAPIAINGPYTQILTAWPVVEDNDWCMKFDHKNR
jgi:hypothetical protein